MPAAARLVKRFGIEPLQARQGQFVEPARGHLASQVAFLGLLFALLGFVTDGCYALVAGTAGQWLRRSRRYLELERYISGTLFIGLGLTAVFAGNQKK